MSEPQDEDYESMELARGKRRKELLTDLQNMVNNPESSDMAFTCSDGICVHVSRLLLASRCSVLKGMSSNGMLESNMTEILLPNHASPVILAIAEYLYTGAIELHCPHDWKMGFEMISAAQVFIIPAVQEIAQGFLRGQSHEITEKPVLTEMLSTAVEFQGDWDGKDDILQDVVRLIGPDWSDEDLLSQAVKESPGVHSG